MNRPLKLASLQIHTFQISQRWLEAASQLLPNLTSLELHNCSDILEARQQSVIFPPSATFAPLRQAATSKAPQLSSSSVQQVREAFMLKLRMNVILLQTTLYRKNFKLDFDLLT